MTVNPLYPPGQGKAGQSFSRLTPTHVDARVLGVATNETHTVPSGARYVVFSCDDAFYAKKNGAAAVPSDDVTDGSASELRPGQWYLVGDPAGDTTTIGLIAPAATIVTLSFYSN